MGLKPVGSQMSWTILGKEAMINRMVSEKGVKRPSVPTLLLYRQEPEASEGESLSQYPLLHGGHFWETQAPDS